MEHPYNSHTILITCWPTLEPFGFVPEVRINDKQGFVVKTFKFSPNSRPKQEPKVMLSPPPKNGSTTAIPSFFKAK